MRASLLLALVMLVAFGDAAITRLLWVDQTPEVYAWHRFGVWRVLQGLQGALLYAFLAVGRPWPWVIACCLGALESSLVAGCGAWWMVQPVPPVAGQGICETLTGQNLSSATLIGGAVLACFLYLVAIYEAEKKNGHPAE